uniref:RNA transcription, translation and transport factor protein n=1 Tax=Rousettus aegyptiacus TaxID=9407 RepID=A0A7J8JG52_ROUAE|nr:hypothetical protein HJG63_010198 [Rousettus aegyptiacus]
MFRRKLMAFDYHFPASFNYKDETEFRNFLVWLEDQKIRNYKTEDREVPNTGYSCKSKSNKRGLPVVLDKHLLGFDTKEAILNEAAQILRLLRIEMHRELETKINEAIVAVRAIIADPKTDHGLGKGGR